MTRKALKSVVAVAALTLVACGSSDEPTFTPESFVDAMNEHGAALSLGPVLTTNPDGIDIHIVTFSELDAGTEPASDAPPTDVHGSATLIVLNDDETAEGEYARCQVAPILTCFRGANAVLRVEGLQAVDGNRITAALNEIEAGNG